MPSPPPFARSLRDLSDTRPSLLMQLRQLSAGAGGSGRSEGGASGAGGTRGGLTPEGAWQRFFEMYSPPVYRVAVRRGLSEADAEDVVQQVMMAVLGHIGTFEYQTSRGRFRHWVLKIAERKIADAFRKRKVGGGITTQLAGDRAEQVAAGDGNGGEGNGIGAEGGGWDEQWRLQDLLFCLDEVAAEIAPRRMEAFRLYVIQGVPAAATAKMVGMTIGHVYVTRGQVLKLIRAKLEELARVRGEETSVRGETAENQDESRAEGEQDPRPRPMHGLDDDDHGGES